MFSEAVGPTEGDLETSVNVTETVKAKSATDTKSVKSSCSKKTGSSLFSSRVSNHSSQWRIQEEANAAALKAELEAQIEEDEREEELNRLELDETKQRILEEAEQQTRRAEAENKIVKKRRELERQRAATRLKIQQARLEVMQDRNADEPSAVDCKSLANPQVDEKIEKPLSVTKQKETVMADNTPIVSEFQNTSGDSAFHNTNPSLVTPVLSQSLNPLAPEWKPPSTKGDIQLIADALSASVSLGRLPVPEPPVFTGDALSYPDWKASFAALIESRGIPPSERIYYLKRYVGGRAREMVSGYFLLKGEDAFDKAKRALEDRYGDPFIISEAFRDKLESWPKISSKDSIGLRRYADFLAQCEVAIPEVKGLEILNDCRENQKMLQKLPDWLVSRWSRIVSKSKTNNQCYPSFSTFVKFVTNESKIACDPIASVGALKQEKEKTDQKARPHGSAKSLATGGNSASGRKGCSFCKRENHTVHECKIFERKPLPERHHYVKAQGLCYRCLEHGHQAKNCIHRSTCKRCRGKHPTCLHEEKNYKETSALERSVLSERASDVKSSNGGQEIQSARCDGVSADNKEEMSTMVVPVWVSSTENPERELLVYALLDTQSDTTFVLQQTAESLETEREQIQLRLSTMTDKNRIVRCHRLRNLVIRGFKSDIRIKLPVTYTREYIPVDESHIPTPETAKKWPHLSDVVRHLHPLLNCDVGLLIGYNCPQALAPRRCITGKGNQPFAVETDLGWSIVGRGEHEEDSGDAIGLSHRVVTRLVPKNIQLSDSHQEVKFACKMPMKEETIKPVDIVRILESDFSEVHEKGVTVSQDDIRFMKTVEEGIYKEDGHYVMPLPFKGMRPQLPNNKLMATRRLENLKRRFLNDSKYYMEYKGFIEDILLHGDAERIEDEDSIAEGEIWYIPHHGIYHPKKPDKIRVVFDCSAKFKGVSLNDHLLQGPDFTNSLVGVLCRFRQEPTAVMCDIERMFHQFYVHPKDRDYLRFLWWDRGDLNTEPVEYRMNVHLFGAVSSPGCANYGLKRVARDNPQFGPRATEFVTRNFYVDDGLTSVDTTEGAISLISNARNMCAEGGLRLHKFASNNRAVMDSVPISERAANLKTLDLSLEDLPVERALGIQWCIESDDFQFRLILKDQPLTRRGVLSTVSSVFDPLGLIAPVILKGKQILQELCQSNVDWDEPVPEMQRVMWEKWRLELPELANFKIKRCFKPVDFGEVNKTELHHFSDASVNGYGQCSYVRHVDDRGRIHCSLAIAKARVAPSKPTTVPRLELQAAVTSAQISSVLDRELEYRDMEHYYWTDSKVVLGYINNDARRFHVFVSNRVQKIRNTSSPEQWRYVNTSENPADHASRGLGARELMTSSWFTGPSFLWENDFTASESHKFTVLPDDPEIKSVKVLATKSAEESSILHRMERFSSWTRAVKAITVLRRYIHRKKTGVREDVVTERLGAEEVIIQMVQQVFREDIKGLSRDKPAAAGLQKLDPFIDSQGMLRVGGRLQESSLPYGVKHPLILPRRSHVVNLIIQHCHEQVAHQGRGMTVNKLRDSGYWIIGCSAAVSSVVHKCVVCRRLRGKFQGQKMANLPEERVEYSPPFTYCGIDCFGPFYIKDGRKERKHYGLLFTCLASRAIHIEVIDDMSTDSFLNGLRCCIAIRGQIRMLRCDQGSNFIGAKHELQNAIKEIDSERVKAVMLDHNCDFKMNPPSASHMGGVWERQIRTIRSVLSGILSQSSRQLDSSSLRTLMYEVMAIINSRPLTTDGLNEAGVPLPLSPNHLLTMKTSVVMPPPGEFPKEDLYLKKRWRRVQYLANQFWTRWKREYLQNIQVRQKWLNKKENIKCGDIVILSDEDKARSNWRLARVVETTCSKDDGLVRQAKVLVGDPQLTDEGKRITKPLILERPIHKLIALTA